MNEQKMLCPAKINRTLFLGEKRRDGLHTIKTEMQKIDLYDELEILISSHNSSSFVVKNPNGFSVPDDETNIVQKAVRLFFEDDKVPNLHIRLTKNIPSGAGLGGGSSDAAGTLMCLQKLFPQKKNDIFLLAKQLGCDVPFFLSEANRANAEGVGEIITPLSDIPPLYIVIGKPKRVDISTKWAYQQWDHEGKKGEENDFESVVFPRYKEIRLLAECLKKQNASPVRLCGSGASVYGSFSKEDDAQSALKQIDTNAYWKWSGKTITHRIC